MHHFTSPRRHGFALLLALCLCISGSFSGLAQSPIHGTDGPVLTFAGSSMNEPGMIAVKGENFSPGGSVYLVLFDREGAKLGASRWIEATTVFRDPAGRLPSTGTIHETLGTLCGLAVMTQAYDETTRKWSNILFIERNVSDCTISPRILPA